MNLPNVTNSSACFQVGPRVSILNISPSINNEQELKKVSDARLSRCKDPLERLQCLCLSNGTSTFKDLVRLLTNEHENGNTPLTVERLKQGLHSIGIDASMSDVEAIFEKLGNYGSVSLEKLVKAIKPPLNATREALLDRIFNTIDKSRKGYCTLDELKGCYNYKKNSQFTTGAKSTEEIFKQFLKAFNISAHTDGKVTKEDFFNYYAAFSAAIENDVYFDLTMRNNWEI